MSSTGSRTLQLLSLLQTHRYWSGADLAARLEVSPRTLRRDVDRLRELGYPVQANRGVDGGYQLAPGASLPPLLMDDDEAVAIAVGMQAAANGAVAGIEDAAVRALTKVTQVLPPRLRHRVDALGAVTVQGGWGDAQAVDSAALITVAQGCRDTERLQFDYLARAGDRSRRHVEPHRLVRLGQRWYLVAYDLGRQDWRSFRLDRLAAPLATGVRFRPRELPAADAVEFVRAGITGQHAPHVVEAAVHAPAEQVQQGVGRWGTVEPLDDDSCLLRMTTAALDWPAMVLGSLGAEFEVISPPQLVEHLRDWAARFTRATAEP
jgi:predicted DNA-binding transcriptional regulator YafY